MRKKWVSCHAAGWSTRNLGIALSLVKLNTPLSTNIFSAGSSTSFTSCYTPRFFKAIWCCFKTLPFVKLKDKYWRMGASVYLSHKNWCLLRKCQCWLWKTHFGVIPAQKNGFVLSIPGGRPVKIAMEDSGMQPPLNPCTARHAHTGEGLPVSALGFLVHTFVVQGREPGPVMGLGLHKWVTLNLCVSPLRHQGQLGSSFPLTAAWTSIWQDKAQTSFLKTSIWSSWGHDPGWVSQCAVFKKHYGIQNEIIFLLIIMAVNWSASRPEPTVCNWIFNLFCVV